MRYSIVLIFRVMRIDVFPRFPNYLRDLNCIIRHPESQSERHYILSVGRSDDPDTIPAIASAYAPA